MEKEADFEEVARVMMKHLGNPKKYHPHFYCDYYKLNL